MNTEKPKIRHKQAPKAKIRQLREGLFQLDLNYTEKGSRRRERHVYGSEAEAISAKTLVMGRLENGLAPWAPPALALVVPMLVGEALSGYKSEAKKRSKERIADFDRHLREVFEEFEVESVTYADLLQYREIRRDDYARGTKRVLSDVSLKKELSHLRACFRYAKVVSKRIKSHVFEDLSKAMRKTLFPKEEGKGTYIEPEDLSAILAEMGEGVYRTAVRVLRATGMRKGELAALIWADVRRDAFYLRISKTGPRRVPLTATVEALLPPRNIDPNALVFEAPGGGTIYWGLGAAWDEARRSAGHPRLRLHDLRHSCASDLGALGDLVALKAALGLGSIETYAEHRKDQQATALFARAEAAEIAGEVTRRKSGFPAAADADAAR